MTHDEPKKVYGAVLLKAKDIMNFIMSCDLPPTLTEISRNIAMNKGTVLKILQTLEICGYVRCQGSDKRYYLGTIFLRYGQTAIAHFNIKDIVEPFMADLRDETGETVNLGVLENNMAVLLTKLESPSSIQLISAIGEGLRLYTSAMGKSLLSTFTDQQLQDYITTTKLEKITNNTITEPEELLQNIQTTKKQGYAIEDCENQKDVICVGFPLVKNNQTFGAFSISAPKYRVKRTDLERFIKYGKITQQGILNAL